MVGLAQHRTEIKWFPYAIIDPDFVRLQRAKFGSKSPVQIPHVLKRGR